MFGLRNAARLCSPRQAAGIALLALAVAAGWWWSRPAGVGAQRVLMVRPLEVAPDDAKAQTLKRGLSSDLARMIVGTDTRLSVVDPDDPAGPTGRRVDFIVTGNAQGSGDALHADIRITDGDDPAILWSRSFTRPGADAAALREQMTTRVADVMICALGGRNPSIDEFGIETLRLYMSASEQKHGDRGESAKLLQQVVQRKPDVAHGWAMLAAGTATTALQRPDEAEALHQQAEIYAQHALALDPHDGEAYYARAEAMPGIANWARRMAVVEAGRRRSDQRADQRHAGLQPREGRAGHESRAGRSVDPAARGAKRSVRCHA